MCELKVVPSSRTVSERSKPSGTYILLRRLCATIQKVSRHVSSSACAKGTHSLRLLLRSILLLLHRLRQERARDQFSSPRRASGRVGNAQPPPPKRTNQRQRPVAHRVVLEQPKAYLHHRQCAAETSQGLAQRVELVPSEKPTNLVGNVDTEPASICDERARLVVGDDGRIKSGTHPAHGEAPRENKKTARVKVFGTDRGRAAKRSGRDGTGASICESHTTGGGSVEARRGEKGGARRWAGQAKKKKEEGKRERKSQEKRAPNGTTG